MTHVPLCDCHDEPRAYDDWMESFWRGIKWVLGHHGPVLVQCGDGFHAHPYRDGRCR